ncbi:MAG: hypothetical protein ACK559_28330, partial [bacterium]
DLHGLVLLEHLVRGAERDEGEGVADLIDGLARALVRAGLLGEGVVGAVELALAGARLLEELIGAVLGVQRACRVLAAVLLGEVIVGLHRLLQVAGLLPRLGDGELHILGVGGVLEGLEIQLAVLHGLLGVPGAVAVDARVVQRVLRP